MNKINLLAFNDYIMDSNDLNLKLFVQSLNPYFILSKVKKNELTEIINKYKKETDEKGKKLRLKQIELFLNREENREEKQIKSSKKTTPENIPIIEQYDPKHESLINELEENRRKLKLLQMRGSTDESGSKEYILLDKEIKRIEAELGLWEQMNESQLMKMSFKPDFDYDASKIETFKSIFGDWEKPGTPAWSLINPGGMTFFEVPNNMFAGLWFNPDYPQMFNDFIFRVTKKRKLNYNIVENKENSPSSWIFSLQNVVLPNTIRVADGKGGTYAQPKDIWNKMYTAENYKTK